jgi:hypothetical protein
VFGRTRVSVTAVTTQLPSSASEKTYIASCDSFKKIVKLLFWDFPAILIEAVAFEIPTGHGMAARLPPFSGTINNFVVLTTVKPGFSGKIMGYCRSPKAAEFARVIEHTHLGKNGNWHGDGVHEHQLPVAGFHIAQLCSAVDSHLHKSRHHEGQAAKHHARAHALPDPAYSKLFYFLSDSAKGPAVAGEAV